MSATILHHEIQHIKPPPFVEDVRKLILISLQEWKFTELIANLPGIPLSSFGFKYKCQVWCSIIYIFQTFSYAFLLY